MPDTADALPPACRLASIAFSLAGQVILHSQITSVVSADKHVSQRALGLLADKALMQTWSADRQRDLLRLGEWYIPTT